MVGGSNEKYPLIDNCLDMLDTEITEEIRVRVGNGDAYRWGGLSKEFKDVEG